MPSQARTESNAVAAALMDFYRHADDNDAYLGGKRRLRNGIDELVAMWSKVRFAVADASNVLDWGCRHGVFARLARLDLGNDAQLHGCDLCPPEQYTAFHADIGLHYQTLGHPWLLPYVDRQFDVVLAGGTLEHVANDGQSLLELWRVLRPGGRLVITHLPNAWSASEWLSRRFWPEQAHPRRYRAGATRERLLQHGFLPLTWGWHQMLPTTLPEAERRPRLARWLERSYRLNGTLEWLWPINRFGTTLWIVAEKRTGF